MAPIHGIPGSVPPPLPERIAQQQPRENLQLQDEAPRRHADSISLRGRSTFEAPEMMDFAEAEALLASLNSNQNGLAAAHGNLDPARVARLLEMDVV